MNAVLYCDKRSLNDATNYYINIIRNALQNKGYKFFIYHKISEIKTADLIITVTERYFLFSKLRYPNKKTIYWAQGVGAEEAKHHICGPKSLLRYWVRLISESAAVNHSDLLFCVSDFHLEYYKKKYGYKKIGNCIIMPCYNLHISDYFTINQYEVPSFVYAGSGSTWQGVDYMLQIFKLIKNAIPNAKLCICTADKATFESKLAQYGITNCELKYVEINKLQDELHKHKYGFIIRDNNIINNVATPTKMNSYLASYLIPIFSDAVDDFKRNINLEEYKLMATCPLDCNKIAQQIISFESTFRDYSNYENIVKRIFDLHYNDERYTILIESKIAEYITNK